MTNMRIGLFTDTYRPTINGITYVVDTLKQRLEEQGHEVFIFCPARSLDPNKHAGPEEDGHVTRFRSFSSGFFDSFDISLFLPPKQLKQIDDMQLDVIHVFTPSQIGLLGIQAAVKYDIPLIIQYSTDLYEFVENYPAVLPGALALVGVLFPFSVRLEGVDIKEILKLWRPRAGVTKWNRDIVEKAMTILHSKADCVIALSRKSYNQLKSWQSEDYHYDMEILPSGVDAIPKPTAKQLTAFRAQWKLGENDEIIGSVGRLGEEKNLPLLIKAFDEIGAERPNTKLLFVGDFDFREKLEAMAADSKFPDRIIFTGMIPREELGVAYAVLDVFLFPSLKDTQGWVLHESAHAGLPIVIIDHEVTEVVRDGENGYFAQDDPHDFAQKVLQILANPKKRTEFGEKSKKLAMRYTESRQIHKVLDLYERVISNKMAQRRIEKQRESS